LGLDGAFEAEVVRLENGVGDGKPEADVVGGIGAGELEGFCGEFFVAGVEVRVCVGQARAEEAREQGDGEPVEPALGRRAVEPAQGAVAVDRGGAVELCGPGARDVDVGEEVPCGRAQERPAVEVRPAVADGDDAVVEKGAGEDINRLGVLEVGIDDADAFVVALLDENVGQGLCAEVLDQEGVRPCGAVARFARRGRVVEDKRHGLGGALEADAPDQGCNIKVYWAGGCGGGCVYAQADELLGGAANLSNSGLEGEPACVVEPQTGGAWVFAVGRLGLVEGVEESALAAAGVGDELGKLFDGGLGTLDGGRWDALDALGGVDEHAQAGGAGEGTQDRRCTPTGQGAREDPVAERDLQAKEPGHGRGTLGVGREGRDEVPKLATEALGHALAPGAVDGALRSVGNLVAKVEQNPGIECFYR